MRGNRNRIEVGAGRLKERMCLARSGSYFSTSGAGWISAIQRRGFVLLDALDTGAIASGGQKFA